MLLEGGSTHRVWLYQMKTQRRATGRAAAQWTRQSLLPWIWNRLITFLLSRLEFFLFLDTT